MLLGAAFFFFFLVEDTECRFSNIQYKHFLTNTIIKIHWLKTNSRLLVSTKAINKKKVDFLFFQINFYILNVDIIFQKKKKVDIILKKFIT